MGRAQAELLVHVDGHEREEQAEDEEKNAGAQHDHRGCDGAADLHKGRPHLVAHLPRLDRLVGHEVEPHKAGHHERYRVCDEHPAPAEQVRYRSTEYRVDSHRDSYHRRVLADQSSPVEAVPVVDDQDDGQVDQACGPHALGYPRRQQPPEGRAESGRQAEHTENDQTGQENPTPAIPVGQESDCGCHDDPRYRPGSDNKSCSTNWMAEVAQDLRCRADEYRVAEESACRDGKDEKP